jgi:hypothetical protein
LKIGQAANNHPQRLKRTLIQMATTNLSPW